jgi:hypothetical protein
MALLISCPECLNLCSRATRDDGDGPLTCPFCSETFIPSDEAFAEQTAWFVLRGPYCYGPFLLNRLQQLIALGWVTAEDQLTRLGADHWCQVGRIQSLFPGARAGTPRPSVARVDG